MLLCCVVLCWLYCFDLICFDCGNRGDERPDRIQHVVRIVRCGSWCRTVQSGVTWNLKFALHPPGVAGDACMEAVWESESVTPRTARRSPDTHTANAKQNSTPRNRHLLCD